MSGPERALVTVLFTDIVGSTERATSLGDRAWGELLAEHHARVRRALRRFGGWELNTAGDGFLAVFQGPARAIACADAIRSAVREVGLEVRCGIHMGEVEGKGKTFGGIGVHIASRVMGEAGPGEVLVSRSVRDSVEGAGFAFEDRGARTLKGVAGERRLFAVTGVPDDVGRASSSRWSVIAGRRSALLGGAVVCVLLVGAAAVYLSRRDAGFALNAEEVLAAGAEPGIAVLPFTVNDPDLAMWREGMVDLLWVNLDGVLDLRAIESRTVLARWAEAVPDNTRADLATALSVARSTGARYALTGTMIATGGDLRITAEVYEARTGTRLGLANVSGDPDSILVLVDRLTMEVLRTLPRDEGVLEDVDLAEITTDSLTALKAFLNGEALYRRSDFTEAAAEFELAIESDSTFALAWARLEDTCGWNSGSELCGRIPLPWPDELLRRLPDRLAESLGVPWLGSSEEIALLQRLANKYPDDPSAWFRLGDGYTHHGATMVDRRAEADRAFERAIALAPTTSAEPYIHLIENALSDGDSARADRLLRAYESITKGRDHAGFLAFDLGFGDRAARNRAVTALDTVNTWILFNAVQLMGHPRLIAASEEPVRVLLARPDLRWDFAFRTHYRRGNLRGALNSSEPWPNVYRLHQVGPYLPPDELERLLVAAAADTAGSDPVFLPIGAFALDRGRREEFEAALDWEREQGRILRAQGDSIAARNHEGAVRALEGYALWKDGRKEEAIRALEEALQTIGGGGPPPFMPGLGFNVVILWWLGDLMSDLGRPQDAVRYFRSISADPYAALRLGKIYADLGEFEKARESYEYAVLSLQNADPELQPQIQEARRVMARLPQPLRRDRS